MTTTQDPQAPATKQDIRLILAAIDQQGATVRGEIFGMRDKLWGEMIGIRDELHGEMAQWTEHILNVQDIRLRESEARMVEHFHVVAENLRYDMLGTDKDKIQSHHDQLQNHE